MNTSRRNTQKRNKRLAGILALTVCAGVISSPAASVYAAEPGVTVDEAVYVNLDAYGKVDVVSVVKGCALNGNAAFTDYGEYESVTNMTNGAEPVLTGDGVTWNLPEDAAKGRFYYECRPKDPASVPIPWTLDVSYLLNGVPAKAEELAGEKGVVEIRVKAVPNPSVNEYYRNNMVLTAMLSVDLQDVLSFEAPGAQIQSVGTTRAAIFACLPGEEGEFTFRVGSDSFENSMGVIFAIVPATLEQLSDVKELKKDKETIQDNLDAVYLSVSSLLNVLNSSAAALQETQRGLQTLTQARDTAAAASGELLDLSGMTIQQLNQTIEQMAPVTGHIQSMQGFLDDLLIQVNGMNGVMKNIQPLAKEMAQELRDLNESLTFLYEDLTDSDKYAEVIAQLTDLERDMTRLQGYLVELDSDADSLTRTLGGMLDQTGELAAMAGQIMSGTLPPAAAGPLAATLQSFIGSLNSLKGSTSDFVDTTENISGILQKMLETGAEDAGKIRKQLSEDRRDIMDAARTVHKIPETLAQTLDELSALADNMDGLVGTLNEYQPEADLMLTDAQTLVQSMMNLMSAMSSLTGRLQQLMQDIQEPMDAGSSDAMRGASAALGKALEAVGVTSATQNALDVLKSTVDKQFDKLDSNSNLLDMDPEAAKLSFTSEKNPAPDSLQIILRTEEISLPKEESSIADGEKEPKKESALTRMANVFVKIWNFLVSLFRGED